MKFTAEISDTETIFLDPVVYQGTTFNEKWEKAIIDVKTHFKQKPSSIYIFTSCHPPIVKMDLTNKHFHSKLLDHPLLITSYLVTIESDHHWTCLKMCAKDKRTSTENFRCWCFIFLEKSQKKLKGKWHPPPPPPPPHPLYVRGLKGYFFEKAKLWQRTCLLEPKH